MKKTNLFIKKVLLLALISALIATVALGITGCNKTPEDVVSSSQTQGSNSDKISATELGVGNTQFKFTVVTNDGKQTEFLINTDKKTVGEALIENKLIEGEDSTYGLYVKTVNGTTLDFDKDGLYWAFYVNGSLPSGCSKRCSRQTVCACCSSASAARWARC